MSRAHNRKIVNFVNNLFLSNDYQVELFHSENEKNRLFTIIVNTDNYQKILNEKARARLQVGLEDSKKIQAKLANIEPEFNKLKERIKASFVTEDLKSRFDRLEREFYIAVTKSKNMEDYRTIVVINEVVSFACEITEIDGQVTELEQLATP